MRVLIQRQFPRMKAPSLPLLVAQAAKSHHSRPHEGARMTLPIVVGISGATGVIYGIELLRALRQHGANRRT